MQYYGQNLQDKYIYDEFKDNIPSKKGTFLDIGASDGVRFSNTLFFEEVMGYTGLCIEPRKVAFESLKKRRKCHCENVAVDSKPGNNVEFLELKGYGSGLSGLVRRYDPRHIRRILTEQDNPGNKGQEIIKVKTVLLEDLLDKYNLHTIDICSLDVEGAELDILKSIDWTKTKISILIVENNYGAPELKTYLESVGFKYHTTIQRQDEVYTNFN